jgi:hypothetical protein
MNIVEFYKRLSRILEMRREGTIGHASAEFELKELLHEAEKSNLKVNVSNSILDMSNLVKYDDENSFTEDYSSYNSSYDPEESESSF